MVPLRMKQHQSQGWNFCDILEEGRVEYVPVASPAVGPRGRRRIISSTGKWKKMISRSPVKLLRKFEISSPPATSEKRSMLEDLSFASVLTGQASHGKSRRSAWDRGGAPVFQMVSPKRQFAAFQYSLFSPLFLYFWTVFYCIYLNFISILFSQIVKEEKIYEIRWHESSLYVESIT